MSWFNRFTSGARRLASNITDSVRRRVTDFGNWLTGYVGPDQTSQVLREVAEHVRGKLSAATTIRSYRKCIRFTQLCESVYH